MDKLIVCQFIFVDFFFGSSGDGRLVSKRKNKVVQVGAFLREWGVKKIKD